MLTIVLFGVVYIKSNAPNMAFLYFYFNCLIVYKYSWH